MLQNYLGGGIDLAMLRCLEGVGSSDSLLLTDPGVLPHAELDELNKTTHANQAKQTPCATSNHFRGKQHKNEG